MSDLYLLLIVSLLPLSAGILVFQVNPYHALVGRGILGAVATLVYAVLGAADVALTEALVGTMLAITLYAVAVRSSLVMRLGISEEAQTTLKSDPPKQKGSAPVRKSQLRGVLDDIRSILGKRHMRLELVTFPNAQSLHQALASKHIHGICEQRTPLEPSGPDPETDVDEPLPIQMTIRIRRLHDIFETELSSSETLLKYMQSADGKTSEKETTGPKETHP